MGVVDEALGFSLSIRKLIWLNLATLEGRKNATSEFNKIRPKQLRQVFGGPNRHSFLPPRSLRLGHVSSHEIVAP
jgi:hypothetical protein